jgi:hypothetical protein
MLRTILATLAVASTLVAVATPANLAKGLLAVPSKPKARVALLKGKDVKAVKAQDCANCDQSTCTVAPSCDGCPLTSCGK